MGKVDSAFLSGYYSLARFVADFYSSSGHVPAGFVLGF